MAPREQTKRKRGRPPIVNVRTPTPPPAIKKTSSRLAVKKEPAIDNQRTTRKRGRPSSHSSALQEDASDAKRRRDASPISKVTKRAANKVDDENESDHDDEGEKKIDKHGNLLGDREFKVQSFTLKEHGKEVLVLAMEPSKLLGYRDSHILFQKHPDLKRVRISDEERQFLIDEGILITRFKNPEVAVVTARSLYKCFGHKVIQNGKRIIDDYYEDQEFEGVLEQPIKDKQDRDEEEVLENSNSRKSLIGKTVRSEGYQSNVPLNNTTWMHHAALAARGFNAQLHERRIGKPTFYDIHSNINQVPSSYQTNQCHFEFSKDNSGQPITFVKKENNHNLPIYRGIGKDLLDDNNHCQQVILNSFATDKEKHQVQQLLSSNQIKQEKNDDYPLALMEGQFQSRFPIHQARFNYPVPKIPDPTNLIDTAQSLQAQQYYLGLVYQSVNQYADPTRQQQQLSPINNNANRMPPPPAPPMNYPPLPQQPLQPLLQQQQPLPIQQIQQKSILLCNAVMPGNQLCRHPVGRLGDRCAIHSKQLSDYAKAPPPPNVYSDNKCADCHQLRASEELFKNEQHITDDFAVVKCSKCTRKYHPICANLTTPKQVAAVESYPWLCPECQICCVCKSAGDESTLMICDGCDRGWHTGCCNVDDVPEGEWLCPLCANCHSCNSHNQDLSHAIAPSSDRYKYPVYLATYCTKCSGNFNDDRFCPVCLKTYSEEEDNEDEDNEMVACDSCDHWVHTKCDIILTPEKYQILCDDEEAKYSCPMCQDRIKRTADTSTADLALKGLSAPTGTACGLLGGKVKTRGVVTYKNIKIGVPEIDGTGIAEMPAKFSKKK